MQELAQRLLIFGTHVHVGIEDREFLVDCMNVVALSAAAHTLSLNQFALLDGTNLTGLKSYRSIVFRNFPRSGIPRVFNSWADLQLLVETLVKTNILSPMAPRSGGTFAPTTVSHAGIPHLRRVHASGRSNLHCGHLPGDHCQDFGNCAATT